MSKKKKNKHYNPAGQAHHSGLPTQPADYLPPREERPLEATKITVQGIELSIDPAAMDDVELFDMLSEFGANEAMSLVLLPRMMRALFGSQVSQIMDHLRDSETGRVKFATAEQFIADAFKALDPNSSRSPSLPDSTAGNSQPISSATTTTRPDGS